MPISLTEKAAASIYNLMEEFNRSLPCINLLTFLSSIEWKLITINLPPGLRILVALIIPSINSDISLLTKILIAWKVLVAGFFLCLL